MKYVDHLADGGTKATWYTEGAWTPKSDTDLAVFSDQLKVGAMKMDNLGHRTGAAHLRAPINTDYGIHKTGAPGEKAGFSNPDGLFDFKLSVGNTPFTTPPTIYRGPTAIVEQTR
jgi:hypothetical protein